MKTNAGVVFDYLRQRGALARTVVAQVLMLADGRDSAQWGANSGRAGYKARVRGPPPAAVGPGDPLLALSVTRSTQKPGAALEDTNPTRGRTRTPRSPNGVGAGGPPCRAPHPPPSAVVGYGQHASLACEDAAYQVRLQARPGRRGRRSRPSRVNHNANSQTHRAEQLLQVSHVLAQFLWSQLRTRDAATWRAFQQGHPLVGNLGFRTPSSRAGRVERFGSSTPTLMYGGGSADVELARTCPMGFAMLEMRHYVQPRRLQS
jgi:hypothetical protein